MAIGSRALQAAAVGVPSRFEIALDGNSPRRQCRIMWRTDRLMGVAFGSSDATGQAA